MKPKVKQSLPSKGKHKNAPGLPNKAPGLHAKGVARAPRMDTTSPEEKR
jgi:hypothetical protein